MDELNGRMMAFQILLTGLIARSANDARDPLGFLSDFRDEMRAVIRGVRIDGLPDGGPVRDHALRAADEMFSLMKAPANDQ
ncbi:hypothetical protein M2323_001788 [Rhodoblastus acidophilus]|uniref:hypothetical protein n=1 Tax=Rhodoblastus acidophilus TaxID=1074 RepID=UPI00161D211D|nr:hypothetical protein [Rhodoblastus acidophilus]MCW2283780.1 hypothetical protein [Rhodoblastus acidophilus]MCW2332871.1 hypothetical protein [Rhodoblastus acidophilus]